VSAVVAADDVERFGELVGRRLGLRVPDRPGVPVSAILDAQAERCGVSVGRYLDRLEADPDGAEVHGLARDLTVAESYFFRDADQLAAFSRVALPERIRAGGGRAVQILSAGCAGGEEPYTLAILANMAVREPTRAVSILGVDINPAVLRAARAGCYSSWALRATPPEMRDRWFRGDGRQVAVRAELRASVRFEQRNLAEPDSDLWRPGRYDIIFCRNVLMYFTERDRASLVAHLVQALAPGGFLFLGHAEGPRGNLADLGLCRSFSGYCYQRVDAAGVTANAGAPLTGGAVGPGRTGGDGRAVGWVEAVGRASRHIDALAARTREARPEERSVAVARPTLPIQAQVRQLSPYRAPIAAALGLLRAERFSDALEELAGLPEGVRDDPAVLLLNAVLLAAGGEFVRAEQACRRLLGVDPRNAAAHYTMATCRHGAGDQDGAIAHSRWAARLDPAFAMPRLLLGLQAANAGDQLAACDALGQARVLLPHEDDTRLLLFGGGFSRADLVGLCDARLRACGSAP
jgi:chemotaxis protein methyltransferase CheR